MTKSVVSTNGAFKPVGTRKGKGTSRVNMFIGPERYARLKKLAKRNGITVTALVIQMIDHCLKDMTASLRSTEADNG